MTELIKGGGSGGPKVPQRPQQRRQQQKIQPRSAAGSQQQKEPCLAPAHRRQEPHHQHQSAPGEQGIRQVDQPTPPQGPQQIIDHPTQHPQQRRLPQQQQLGGDIVLHSLSRTAGTAGRCALRQAPHS